MNTSVINISSKLIIFDLDGTLVNTFDDLFLALESTLLAHQLPTVTPETLLDHIHLGLESTVHAVTNGAATSSMEIAQTYEDHYRQRYHSNSYLYPGVLMLLHQCQKRRQRLAVCTNKSTSDANALLDVLGIKEYFSIIVGIDTLATSKPDPAPLNYILDAFNCSPSQAVFIGDSIIDAQCAKNAGVPFLLHRSGFGGEEALDFGYYQDCFGSYAELVIDEEAPG